MNENRHIRILAALRAIKEATLAVMDPERSGSPRVVVGLATCGIAAGAQDVYDALKNELKAQGMDYVLLEATGCVGICQFEPVVEVYIPHQPRTTYVHMTPDKAVRVVQQHLRGGNPLSEYTIGSVQ